VIRSALFVPAHRDGWVEKAIAAGPDAVILDLEDSVPPSQSEKALELADAGVASLVEAGVAALVRPREPADLGRLPAEGLSALLLPKIDTLDQVERYAGLAPEGAGLVVTLETASAYLAAAELARAPRVVGLFAATGKGGDAQRELGYRPTPAGLETLYARSRAVLAARAARLPHILAGPWQELADVDGLREQAAIDRNLGFTGGVLIHPAGIPVVNEAYSPSTEELDYHLGLVSAYEEAERHGVGAVDYRGDHVDAAHYRTSRELLASARQLGLLEPTNEGGG
jgi:citrate lyase subunit beta / citryl-CoA lyase